MTNKEAKDYIREWCPYDKQEEIIKALEQPPCPYWDYELKTCRHANIGALATKPCEDAISSEPIKIDEWDIKGKTAELWIVNGKLQIRYQGTIHNTDLPPVTPKQETGMWVRTTDGAGHYVWECNKCGWQQRFANNHCPDCGRKMMNKI